MSANLDYRNQFDAIVSAYRTTIKEGAPINSAWAALNAITRYVDHDRGPVNDRFNAAQFGSGALIKDRALAAFLPYVAA